MPQIQMPKGDGLRVKSDYDLFGFAQFRAVDGRLVHIAHAYRDGELEVLPSDEADVIVCCHPTIVAKRYNLPVVGDWEGETKVEFYDSAIRVKEKIK
jgi:hypothetical protein